MNKEQIYKNNKHLGIETLFFKSHAKDMHGYIDDGFLFLNENSDDLALSNRYAILHFYESSPAFKRIKQEIFANLSKEEKKELRDDFLINCALLFDSNKQKYIDNEIVHSIILGDQFVSKYISKIVDGAYEEIISSKKLTPADCRRVGYRVVNLNIDRDYSEFLE